jgi:hypothetical protein
VRGARIGFYVIALMVSMLWVAEHVRLYSHPNANVDPGVETAFALFAGAFITLVTKDALSRKNGKNGKNGSGHANGSDDDAK